MAITVGSVEVDIIPNTTGIYAHLKTALEEAGAKAGKDAGDAAGKAFGPAMQAKVGDIGLSIGQQIGEQIANRIKDAVADALKTGITIGGQKAKGAATRQGDETGGAFARALRAKLTEAFRAMPKLQVSLADTGVDAELARLRARMETLSNKRIGVDVDVAAADAEVADISERLQRLGAAHPNVTVRSDTAAARAALEQIREEIARVSAQRGVIRLETDGSFGARMRAAVEAAQASLPNINVGADTSPAQAELASLRAQLTSLRDQRVGIDIDAATASARIDEIRVRLATLSASDADIAVRVDAAAAEAQLAQVGAMASALDGKDIDLHVSNAQALSAVFQVAVAIAALAAIPAIPVLAAGTGSLVSAFTAAGVGVGAFAAAALPALSNIKGALTAQKAAQDAASKSTNSGAQAASQAASKALQQAGAQQALAAAERNSARQISQAQAQVVQAKRAVGDAVAQAALQQQQADRAVVQAERAVTDAVSQAALQRQQANRAVVQAERQVQQAVRDTAQAEKALAQAQRDSKQAQLDLTSARKAASDQLVDINNQVIDAQLSQRRAAQAVKDATKQLTADKAKGSKATVDQIAADQLAYDEAVQNLAEQQIATQRLQDQAKAANKAGVTGSDTYKQAQDKLAQAQQSVADKTQGLADSQQGLTDAQQGAADAQAARTRTEAQNARAVADAQQAVADALAAQSRTEVQNSRAVADARQKVADAERGVADAQASAADSIASAQRQVASASLSAAGGMDASATAAQNYLQALAKLSPSARGTFNAFVGLRTAFKAWSLSLQPKTMPIFTRALNGLKNSLPGVTPLVLGAARGISTLQDKVSKGFKSPWWKSFKADFAKSVEPAIVGVGTALGHVFVGAAGIVDAFLPHVDSISDRMDRITGRFSNFGKNLKGSPAFERFLDYSSQQAPILAKLIGDIASSFFQVSKALAPLSGPLLGVVAAIARGIGSIAENLPWLIKLIYLAFVATRIWTIGVAVFNAVADANPIVLIVIAIVALVAAVIYAYKNFTWFRVAVQAAWAGIQAAALYAWNVILKPVFAAIVAAALWLWTNGIKPAFDGIVTAYRAVASAAVWLWQTILAPVFKAIAVVVGVWWAAVKIYFTAVITIVKMVAAIALWLWHQAFDPIFKALGKIVSLWWSGVKLYFNAVIAIFRAAGSAASWLWTNAIRPSFQAIGDLGKWLWSKALQPAFGAMKTGIKAVGDSFVTAKDLISDQWSKVADLAKKPIKFLIDTVYNKGIIGVWNKVADIVDGPKLKPLKVKGFATGGVEGVRPGYTPGRDTHLIAVGGGEAIMRPEWTRALGSGYVDQMNAAARSGGVAGVQRAIGAPGFFGGGIIDTVTGAAKNVAGKVGGAVDKGVDWVKTGADLIANPSRVFDRLAGPIKDLIKKMGTSKWAKLTEGIPSAVLGDLKDKALSLIGLGGGSSGGGGGGGKIPTGQHAAIISQAMAAAHVPPPGTVAQWLSGMNTLISRESGWNASAINLWDSNAMAGHPSQGLTQTIPGTWAHYVPASLKSRGILDPVGNVAAAIRYIVSRYGNIANVQQANASMPPQGYDNGGWLMPGQLGYNGLGKPEAVFTPDQFAAFEGAAKNGGTGATNNYTINARTADFKLSDLQTLQRQQEARQRVGRPY